MNNFAGWRNFWEMDNVQSLTGCMTLLLIFLMNPLPVFAQTQNGNFNIDRFNVEGNTQLQSDEIDDLLKPFTGKSRDYADVQHAIRILKQRYSALGFNVAVWEWVPEQDFSRGVVTLHVVEAPRDRVFIEGYLTEDSANITPSIATSGEKVSLGAGKIPAGAKFAGDGLPGPVHAQVEHFDIDHFKIEGNTLLKPDEIGALLKPFTGKLREYGDVRRALNALRQCYRSAGFGVVWVTVPEQDINHGVVVLQVIEARIGKVSIKGNRFFDDANIRSSLPALVEKSPPRTGDISANAQLANENPAKQIDVLLRPGEKPGVVDAVVNVIDVPPLKTFLTLDNTGNSQTGNFRLGVGMQHANLFNRDDVGTFSYVTSPGKWNQVSLYSGSYRMPLYSLGDSIDFVIARSDVSAGTAQTVAGPLTFSGMGDVYAVRYNQLLERRGEYSHRVVYGLDDRAYKNNCTLGSFGAPGCGPAAVDITVRPVSIAYSGNWTTSGRISDFYVNLSRNIPGGANGQAGDFNAVRPSPNGGSGASSQYKILRFGGSMVNAFKSNWQIRAAFNAQYTPDALVSGEQLGVTGATAVRGFLEREIALDTGYIVNLEFYTPNLLGDLIPGDGNLRALLFYDAANAANNPLAGEGKQQASIASAGVGLRWNIRRDFNMRLDLARVMNGGGSKKAGDLGANLSVYSGF